MGLAGTGAVKQEKRVSEAIANKIILNMSIPLVDKPLYVRVNSFFYNKVS